jgi:hypothetical protein
LWFQTRPGSYNDERLMAFLRDLKKHMRGQKVIPIWDGLPAQKSRKMKQYLESQRSRLQVETLPGYSPDLNPVEDLWSNIKGQELANRCVAGLGEAEDGVCSGMDRVRQSMLPFSAPRGAFFDSSCHPITRDSVKACEVSKKQWQVPLDFAQGRLSIPCCPATLGVRSLKLTKSWGRCAILIRLDGRHPTICNCCEGCHVSCNITALAQVLAAARRYQATWEISHVA